MERISRFENFQKHRDIEPIEKREGRPDDIEVGGISLLKIEKTPLQQEVAQSALSFVQEHLQNLGITGRSFDSRRITYVDYYGNDRGSWNIDDDWVVLSTAVAEANVHTSEHELLHAFSAEWQYKARGEVESKEAIRPAKTGFSTVWQKKEHTLEAPAYKKNFSLLNEAVTEKIAREITAKHEAYIAALPRKYETRFQEHIARAQEYVNQGIAADREQFEKKKAEIIQNMEAEIKRHQAFAEQSLADLDKLETEARNPEMLETERTHIKEHQDIAVKYARETADILIRLEESHLEVYKDIMESKTLEHIRNAWLKPTESGAYEDGIKMLDLLLEGMALQKTKEEKISYEEAHAAVWTEMQKAYFNGKTIWLRTIEKTFGEGAFRSIGELAPDPLGGMFGGDDKTKEVLTILEEIVKNFRQTRH